MKIKYLYIAVFIILGVNSIFSENIIKSEDYYEPLKLSIGTGTHQEVSFFDDQYQTRLEYISGENRSDITQGIPEVGILFQGGYGFKFKLNILFETGAFFLSQAYGLYDVISVPLRAVAEYNNLKYSLGVHAGFQAVYSEDPFLGDIFQLAPDIGVRAGLYGIELRIGYNFERDSLRKGLYSSLIYNVPLR